MKEDKRGYVIGMLIEDCHLVSLDAVVVHAIRDYEWSKHVLVLGDAMFLTDCR